MDNEVIRKIENLIDDFANKLSDADFLEVLDELIDRAQTAKDARIESMKALGRS